MQREPRTNPEPNPPRENTRAEQARLKHGCYARSKANGIGPLIRNENPAEFALFRQGWLARLAPQTVSEQEFADSFIADGWRLLRAQAAETALLNQEIRSTKTQFEAAHPQLKGGERKQARLGFAVASLYKQSTVAVALNRKISQIQAAQPIALRSMLLLQSGRSQELTKNKTLTRSVLPNPAPGEPENAPN